MLAYDVVVVGAGLAGQRAALAAAEAGAQVAILSKVYPTRSHSGAAQGGINAAVGPGDSWQQHLVDTILAGDGLVDQDAAEVLCRAGPAVIEELERWGALFDRNPDGTVATRPLGGRGVARACYVADLTGHAMLQTLFERILRQGTPIHAEWYALELTVEDGRCAGLVALDLRRGAVETVRAKAVVLATGGYGQLYRRTTSSLDQTGDGVALAYRAGARLSDLEFVQFHPTTLANTNILISEACRIEGGYLLNVNGERFMQAYAPTMLELAPPEVVARAIASEIRAGRGFEDEYVLLDLRHLGPECLRERLPRVLELARRYAGVDATSDPIPVQPGQHYSIGGVRTNVWGETTLPGLLAAGECANVSVHGADRLDGNSLLETVVFGRRAGERAAALAAERDWPPLPRRAEAKVRSELQRTLHGRQGTSPGLLKRELADLMTRDVGVFRTGAELGVALERLAELRREYAEIGLEPRTLVFNYELAEHIELGGLLELAEVLAAGALWREESRGAHVRLDFPARDDERWLCHTFADRAPAGPELKKGEVRIASEPPEARRE